MSAILSGTHRYSALERVIFGRPAADALMEEVEALGARKVFVTTTRSLAGPDGLTARLATRLGPRLAGTFSAIAAHSPRSAVIEGAAQARAAGADLLVAVGGGSVIDATKVMLACLWHGFTREEQLDPLGGRRGADASRRPAEQAGAVRMLAIPTTYSAAEFTHYAGVTDTRRGIKDGYAHPYFVPQTVILDPEATRTAPLPLLLSTGIRAVDHAVERLCSLQATPFSDAASGQALTLLAQALPAIQARPDELKARADGQLGMWLSTMGGAEGVGVGASHAIGHTLGGSYGVPHGVTSCVMLPAVLRWNAAAVPERESRVSALMGRAGVDAGQAVADLVAGLGLPGRLRDVGIRREDFRAIAEHTMHDPPVRSNPRPVAGPQDLVEILELAW